MQTDWQFDSPLVSLWIDLGDWKVGFADNFGSFSVQILCFELIYWKGVTRG